MSKLSKIIFLILMVTGLSSGATISGFVKDSISGEPLAFANIYLEREKFGTTSNFKGFFVLDGIPAGRHTLVVSYVGFKEKRVSLFLRSEEKLRLNIKLSPSVEVGESLVVLGRRDLGERSINVGQIIVHHNAVRDIPQLAEPDLFRSLQLLPGVTTISDFSSALYIWGGVPSENLVTIDGIDVYNVNHLGGVFSAFNVDAIKEVNLVKGGFPARWGGRVGSVIEVINKEGNRNSVHGMFMTSLLSTHGLLEGPLCNFGTWMVAARRTYFDIITSAMEKLNILDVEKVPYHFTDAHSKVTMDLPNGDKISLSGYYGKDLFDLEEDDTVVLGWGNWTISLNYSHVFGHGHFGNFLLAYSDCDDKFEGAGSEIMHDFVRDLTLRADLMLTKGNHTIEYGGVAKRLSVQNRVDVVDFGGRLWSWLHQTYLVSGYIQDEWRIAPLWRISGGLRANYSWLGHYKLFAPRFSIQRTIDEKTRAKIALGRYYQFIMSVPKFEEMGISLFDTWVMADERIKPMWADHAVFHIETEHIPSVPITVDAYYKRIGNVLRHKAYFTDVFWKMFDQGEGKSFGVDLMARFDLKGFKGWVAYSHGYVINKFSEFAGGKPFYPKHDKRHQVNILLQKNIGKGYTLSLGWVYTTGMPYTEPIGKFVMPYLNGSDFNPFWREMRYYYGGYNNKRVPPYHRLDVGIYKHAEYGKMRVEWFLQVLNVYNRKNIYAYYYSSYYDPYEEGLPQREAIRMFPLLPTFGLSVRF